MDFSLVLATLCEGAGIPEDGRGAELGRILDSAGIEVSRSTPYNWLRLRADPRSARPAKSGDLMQIARAVLGPEATDAAIDAAALSLLRALDDERHVGQTSFPVEASDTDASPPSSAVG